MASSIIFYGYLGFDFITTLSSEAKHPAKSIPYAVKYSTTLCMILYMCTAISLAGMAPLQNFNADTAMADAFSSVELDYVSFIIYFCAFFGITAACFSNLLVSKT
jgi:amino acid transporter